MINNFLLEKKNIVLTASEETLVIVKSNAQIIEKTSR